MEQGHSGKGRWREDHIEEPHKADSQVEHSHMVRLQEDSIQACFEDCWRYRKHFPSVVHDAARHSQVDSTGADAEEYYYLCCSSAVRCSVSCFEAVRWGSVDCPLEFAIVVVEPTGFLLSEQKKEQKAVVILALRVLESPQPREKQEVLP